MKTNFSIRAIIFIIILLSSSIYIFSQENVNERAKWFVDDRFGMFIHWGIYSGAEGVWKGEVHRHDNNYAEWIQYRNRIDESEYITLLNRFNWDSIDPEKWVLLAKQAGMKYVVITAKHHDGFALWDSKASEYDVSEFTNPKRDIIKELASACKKHGLKLGLYYSHWIDWEHQYGWDHTKEITGISPENYDLYWQEKVLPQMRELLTNYGPISIIWFDMWIHYSQTVVTKLELMQLKGLIRELQPECLINSRLGLSVEEDSDVDFQTLGDNQLGNQKKNFPWQSPATVAHSWGYNALDTEWKSTTTLLQSLISNVSLNGNFLLNIGPKSDGDVPYEISQRLLEIGNWLKINGESVYGSGASDLQETMHDWGRITCKKSQNGTNLYLHIFNWPFNNQLNITGITSRPERIYLLGDSLKKPLNFSHSNALTTIHLPANQRNPYVSVVVMEYLLNPEIVDSLVAKSIDGGYSCTPVNITNELKNLAIENRQRRGTIPSHAVIKETSVFKWKVYVDEPGNKTIDVSYSFQGVSDKIYIRVKSAGAEIYQKVLPTGKTVGEPNSNWIIDNYKSHRIGEIDFPEQGYYDLELELNVNNNEQVMFQWLWLQ